MGAADAPGFYRALLHSLDIDETIDYSGFCHTIVGIEESTFIVVAAATL